MTHHDDDAIEALLRRGFDGPVPDDGFSERVMRRLPPRRRIAWPPFAGVAAGVAACWLSLLCAPRLPVDGRDWIGGRPSATAIALLLAAAATTLLCGWLAVAEADES